jgi:hypothetical protein
MPSTTSEASATTESQGYEMTLEEYEAGWASPMPAERKSRLRQILRYLIAHWPPARKVSLSVRRIPSSKRTIAIVEQLDGSLEITINSRACFHHAADLLIHEYAHAATWLVYGSDHGPAWAGVHSALLTEFEDGDAYELSKAW